MVDRVLEKFDPRMQLAPTGAGDLLGSGEAKRDEQQTRLVEVPVVLVDDDDGEVIIAKNPAQPVGG
jgi:hypothetical protein